MEHDVIKVYPVIDGTKCNPWNDSRRAVQWQEEAKCSKGHDLVGTAHRVTCLKCKLWWPR